MGERAVGGPEAGAGPGEVEGPAAPDARILVVDDEEGIRELLTVSLKFQGFAVEAVADGAAGLDSARRRRPDAVILDVMMPGMDGVGMLRRLRADGIDSPVLLLTARDGVEDKVSALTLGADDYVTKPFSLEELIARLRAVLRRAGHVPESARQSVMRFADLELDEAAHEVRKAGAAVDLSPTEFTLLRYLMANAGTVLSKPRILEHVWGYGSAGQTGVVESFVSYLRRKVDTGDEPLIHTVRGVGYVLRESRA